MQTEILHMTLYMCFTETLVIACTVCEILAQIDHQGPNWTLLTLDMTFRVIPHLSYSKTGFTTKTLNDAINLGSTLLLPINIDNWKICQT